MLLTPWLRNLRCRLQRPARRIRRGKQHFSSINIAAEVQQLENRLLLSAVTWTGGGDGQSWNNASNWNTGVLPGASDDVVISAGFASIVHSGGTDTVKSLTSDSPFTLSGGTLTVSTTVKDTSTFSLAGGTLASANFLAGTTITVSGGGLDGVTLDGNLDMTHGNGSRLNVTNGLVLNGTASVGAANGSTWGGIYFYGTQTVGGTGDILLGGLGLNLLAIQTSGTTVTFGSGLTVHGKVGELLAQYADSAFVNDGMLSADGGGLIGIGGGQYRNNEAGSFVNHGTVSASAGGYLNEHLSNWSSSGVITAGSGWTVNLQRTGSNSGSITASSGGTVDLSGSWTSSGPITVNGGGTLNLSNGSNSGSIAATGGTVNFGGTWSNSGSATASTGGVVNLYNDNNSGPITASSGGTVNFGGAWSDRASATLTVGTMNFYNSGTWTAATINTDAASAVNFVGSFTTAGGTLALTGSGLFQLQGGDLAGGTVSLAASARMQISGGTLDNLILNNAGAVAWTSGNIAVVNGESVTNSATGTFDDQTDGTIGVLNEQIGGIASGTQYGQIDVAGTVSLAGTLKVAFINGFVPVTGESFTVIRNDGTNPVGGTFDNLAERAVFTAGGRQLRISYVGNADQRDVVLTDVTVDTSLTESVSSSTYGNQVTFTATVAAQSSGIPTGTETFYEVDSSNTIIISTLGTATLDASGIATFQDSAFSAGTHYIAAAYTSGDANFNAGPLSSSVSLTIAKANATISVTPYSMTYDGSAHTATGTAKGVLNESLSGLALSGTTHTNAGTYNGDAWTFTDVTGNYNNASGTVNDSIAKATATVIVNGYTGVYDGTAHGATGTATGVGGVNLSAALNLGASFTNVPGGTNYSNQSGSVAIVINASAVILLLDPSGAGALTDSGNGTISVGTNGEIIVASTNSAAVVVSGNGKLAATEFDLKSTTGTQVSGNGKITGTIDRGVPAAEAADPLASLAVPTAPTTQFSAVNASGNTVVTLQPGTYVGGIKASGNAKVTLAAGTYYLKGGGFAISGNASVTGSSVFLYNASQTSSDVISISGNGSVVLTAPPSGAYQGVAIFQARNSTAPISIAGNGGLKMTGTLYAAGAAVNLSGNGVLTFQGTAGRLICADLSDSGNGTLTANPSSSGSSTQALSAANGTSDSNNSAVLLGPTGSLSLGLLTVAVDGLSGDSAAQEEARIEDAIASLDADLAPFGVRMVEVSGELADAANIHIHLADTSAIGGVNDGVLGVTVGGNDITLIAGWNWFTGADGPGGPTKVGTVQSVANGYTLYAPGGNTGSQDTNSTFGVFAPSNQFGAGGEGRNTAIQVGNILRLPASGDVGAGSDNDGTGLIANWTWGDQANPRRVPPIAVAVGPDSIDATANGNESAVDSLSGGLATDRFFRFKTLDKLSR